MRNLQFAGIDVDDNAFHVAMVEAQSGKTIEFQCRPDAGVLAGKLAKHQIEGGELRICYEATHIGFSLHRKLKAKGFFCEVIAPSLIPELAGKAQKTNRIDARRLAEFYMKGLLTVVHVPNFDDEMDRDFIRSRKFLVEQQTATKNHITGLCKRLGWDFRGELGHKSYWTKVHLNWLEAKQKTVASVRLKANLRLLLAHFNQISTQLDLYNEEIDNMAAEETYKKKVEALTCYRGIAIGTAMTLVTEIGDIQRFDKAPRLTSYAGLDIREYSSGTKEMRFGISRLGNRHIRTAVVEACQFAFAPVRVSAALKRRRSGVASEVVAVADRCMARLHKKGGRLIHKGKHRNVAKTACAREMLMFVWESLKLAA